MHDDDSERVVPVYEDRIHVAKAQVVTDRLRVTTTPEERAVIVEDTIERGELHVERIAVDRPVAEAPAPRQDGDTLVVSLVEERLVVEKRLHVIEEVRITRIARTERVAIPETLRTTRVAIERPNTTTSGKDHDD